MFRIDFAEVVSGAGDSFIGGTNLFEYIFLLLVVFQAKHFLCDFPLQGRYMLGKFKGGWGWVLPLAAHAAVHAVFTLAIVCFLKPHLWWLSLVDFMAHFAIDRVKASPNLLGRWKPDNKYFWIALGVDQTAHHLTHYWILAMLLIA